MIKCKFFFYSLVRFVLSTLTKIIPKDRQLILFHGATTNHYNENSRYLYEYLSNHHLLKPVWMSTADQTISYLRSQDKRVVRHNTIKGIWCYLRSGFVVGTGTIYPDLLGAVGRKTYKICLGHGVGPRSTNAGRDDNDLEAKPEWPTSLDIIHGYHKWDFVNFTSAFTEIAIGKLQYALPKRKRLNFGYPRCDHLFDQDRCSELLASKPIASRLIKNLDPSAKLILHAPTWRIKNRHLSMLMLLMHDFSLEAFNQFLIEQNAYFLISVHPLVEKREDLSRFERLVYLPFDPLFDVNQLLPEISILVTDYTSMITDFVLMDRPVVLYMPDYDDFLHNRGLLEDFRLLLPGPEVKTVLDLQKAIAERLYDQQLDSADRHKYLCHYYDMDKKQSSQMLADFVLKLSVG